MVYALDGRPLDAAALSRLSTSIEHRGPDAVGSWVDGPVALIHRLLVTTPEARDERQPLSYEAAGLHVTLDGRVDNRDELKEALGTARIERLGSGDAALVLQAYAAWGDDCASRILGDFAFAIWDAPRRRLFCARDILGVKPFYYAFNGRQFVAGSEAQQLLASGLVGDEVNEAMVGEYLTGSPASTDETLYRHILRLPPAHTLVVSENELRRRRYWDLEPRRQVRHRTDREYAEHFLQIFSESVRCRLRAQGPVGVLLSGGVDSSSILAMAQSLYRRGEAAGDGLEALSLAFPGAGCDETAHIAAVVEQWRPRSHVLPYRSAAPEHFRTEARRSRDLPDYPNGAMTETLNERMRALGVRVALTGFGGDEWFTGSRFHYADLVRAGRLGTIVRQVRADRANPDAGFTWSQTLVMGLWPQLPKRMQRVVKRALGRGDAVPLPPTIDAGFARRLNLGERIRRPPVTSGASSVAQGAIFAAATSGEDIHGLELTERLVRGLEMRHPFHDRRLAEFALAIPEEQRWRPGVTKFVIREAMRGMLPESIRGRRDKGEFSNVFVDALEAHGGEAAFVSLASAGAGWVDAARTRELYRDMARRRVRGDDSYLALLSPLWMVLGIEHWLRAVHDIGSPSRQDVHVSETA